MTVELYTLDGTDEEVEEVIALFRLVLGAAEEAEVVHPETVSALRKWCNTEWSRIYPPLSRPLTREQEIQAALRRSPWWPFWESLVHDQEVRWTGTKNATYFVVDPRPTIPTPPDGRGGPGAFIELRRHTGKTFWTHIGKVRPLHPSGSLQSAPEASESDEES
jgi:hypothetical protein